MYSNKAADYWIVSKESKDISAVKCVLCPNYCIIRDGGSGKCGVRKNKNGRLIASAYGFVSSIALDPIEKKPLYKFHSGKNIISIGSFGCNFHCPFCQNSGISMEYQNIKLTEYSPEMIAETAKNYISQGNIGVAFTYNEPLINFEFIKDCSVLNRNNGLMNVLVTNGYINKEPLAELLPLIDAMNIDLKGTASTYNMVGGTQEAVKNTIERAHGKCHVEVTTLVTPEVSMQDIGDMAKWLSGIDRGIPYHLSRFFPRYKYKNSVPTPSEKMYRGRDIAGEHLDMVFMGNMG